MKKNFCIFLCSCFVGAMPLWAIKTDVELSGGHPDDVFDGHPNVVPKVSTDGDDVNIRCDSTINDVGIVIRDQYGAVMHQSTQTIGPNETTIYVPSTDGDSEKTTIDLYYDRKHLSGYFEE